MLRSKRLIVWKGEYKPWETGPIDNSPQAFNSRTSRLGHDQQSLERSETQATLKKLHS